MSIFISYSRKDQAYVNKLKESLDEYGLPVWLDEHIDYGTRWRSVIEENLRKHPVFIVVMSSHSRHSEWVENEVSLALKLKKQIFPLLLEGEEFMELQNLQYTDVKGGKLPPSKFFDQIRSKLPDLKVEPKKVEVSNSLFQKLAEYLKNGQWREADKETIRLMLQIGRKKEKGYLDTDDCRNFPREELRYIDRLWLKYSNNRFGLSVQKEIYLREGGKVEDLHNWFAYTKMSDRIGWRKGWLSREWLEYDDFTFNTNAQKGHLPAFLWGLLARGDGYTDARTDCCSFLFSRL